MRILLTGTRAPATLDLARRLWREGAEVIGADSLRFPLGRFSRAFTSHHRVPPPRQAPEAFFQAVSRLLIEHKIDLLWPTCEEIFHLARFHQSLSGLTRMLCEPLEKLLQLHHKLHFAQFVSSLGDQVLAPDSWPAEQAPSQGRLVWKPCFSRFGAQTRFDTPPENPQDWMAQTFIAGEEFCCWALCVDGIVHALTFYRAAARAGRGASCAFDPLWSEPAAEFVRKLAAHFSFTGSLAFDFITALDGRIFVIECNPRLTSGLHVLDPMVSLLEALQSPLALPTPQRACQVFLPTLFSCPSIAGKSPDVIHSRDDRRPAWGQALSVLEFAGVALRRRLSLLEATTHDIEYNGEGA